MKTNEWKIRPILPDTSIRDPVLQTAIVGTISEKRQISKVVLALGRILPLEKQFQFLKRVNNSSTGKALILVSVTDDLDSVTKQVNPHLEALLEAGLEFPLKRSELFCDAPLSRKQFDIVRSTWPCHFHEDKNLESLLNQTRPNIWSEKSFKKHIERIEKTIELAQKCSDEQSAAIVVDPVRDAIVAQVEDSRHKHPLRHAAMNAIDAVAHAQGAGAWPRDVGDLTLIDSNDKCYLLTGYDVYLNREPCCMCAMALVHSRVSRIFFFGVKNLDRKFGALNSAVKLHTVEGLNHSFEVFYVERTS